MVLRLVEVEKNKIMRDADSVVTRESVYKLSAYQVPDGNDSIKAT